MPVFSKTVNPKPALNALYTIADKRRETGRPWSKTIRQPFDNNTEMFHPIDCDNQSPLEICPLRHPAELSDFLSPDDFFPCDNALKKLLRHFATIPRQTISGFPNTPFLWFLQSAQFERSNLVILEEATLVPHPLPLAWIERHHCISYRDPLINSACLSGTHPRNP
jgi:hypothetical protein